VRAPAPKRSSRVLVPVLATSLSARKDLLLNL
jgi:hypothetical protein